MIENVLRTLGGIERYGVISLCLFCGIFLVVVLWALFQKRSHLDRMARAPLDTDSDENLNPNQAHE
jgi:hypothetical protein